MADKTLVTENRWTAPMIGVWFVVWIFIGWFTVGCQDPTTSIEVRERGRDTIPTFHTDTIVVFHTDTVIVPVVDTTYVWCWEVDHNNDGHSAQYQCDNGYRGPLF